MTIESFSSALFPFLYANVSVKSDGLPVTDLTEKDFQVLENNDPQTDFFDVTPPLAGGGVRLADIVILIDVSGSMGEEIADVRRNVNGFATSLSQSNIDFRLGLVRFGNSSGANPFIFNNGNLTDNVSVFQGFVNTLSASGGFEPGFQAIRQAITGFNFRPGAQKIFLIITDEDSDEPRDKQGTLSMLESNSITVHAAVNCGFGTSRDDYCDDTSVRAATGGLLFGVSSSYNAILDTIVATTGNNYVVRYKSGNPVFDGQERTVVIYASSNGQSGYDTTTYIPGSAPQISLTPETQYYFRPENAMIAHSPLNISAFVIDTIDPAVSDVNLYYRTTQVPGALPISYTRAVMTRGGDNRWAYTIPGADIQNPGVVFYITASDTVETGSSPKMDPSDTPHQIAVLPNYAPLIEHDILPRVSGNVGQDVLVEAVISDTTYSIRSTVLHYRRKGELLYKKMEDSRTGASIAFAEAIPGYVITRGSEIEYYIEAQDDLGVKSWHGFADDPHCFMPSDGDLDEDGLMNGEEDLNADGVINGDNNSNRIWDSGERWTETDPYNMDTDGDALPDGWEVKGFFSDNNLYYDNPENTDPDVDLPAFCADSNNAADPGCASALRKDIFVEIDWMEDDSHDFIHPREEAFQNVITAFNNAPVKNPDGSLGINLHLDYGQDRSSQDGSYIGGGDHIPYEDMTDMGNDWENFHDRIKDRYFPASNHRREIFHYCAFINKFTDKGNSGWSNRIPSSEFIVALGSFRSLWGMGIRGGTLEQQTGTFMPELGHNLGLYHGGDSDTNFKPNYLSVMNYSFQMSGLWKDGEDGVWDYSRVKLPTLNEGDDGCLDETVGLNGGEAINGYGTKFYTDPGPTDALKPFKFQSHTHFAKNVNTINWDRDLDSSDTCVRRSINDAVDVHQDYADDKLDKLEGYNDWDNLIYSGGGGGHIGDSRGATIVADAAAEELDFDTVTKMTPYPPTGLSSRALPTLVRLGWKPSRLEVVTHYNVYRKTSGSSYQLLAITESSVYDDANIVSGTTYTYTVTSGDIYGNESEFTDEIEVTIPMTRTRTR